MEHLHIPQFVGLLVVMLAAAKVLGALAQRIGQPAVLGALVAGVILGRSVLGLVNPATDVLHLFAELGMIILLFSAERSPDTQKERCPMEHTSHPPTGLLLRKTLRRNPIYGECV
jgi:Na+:H+ antiporter